MNMTDRERFYATMHYQPRDRSPLYDFNYWEETVPAWHEQGLPRQFTRATVGEYFGLDISLGGGEKPAARTGVNHALCPHFETEIIQDDGDEYTELQSDGVIVRKQRSSVSIPMHVGHTLTDRDSWLKHYKPRLDPGMPARLPANYNDRVDIWKNTQRDHCIFVTGGSLFGWIRDWMGMENVSMVVYDEPAWFEEMVTTIADLQVSLLEKLFATGAKFDGCAMWEDMCYNAGPLLSPEHFKQFLIPQYRRITDLCRKNGVDVVYLDCDGKIDALLPLWLEAGVNCMFPIEIGTWGADPIRYRKEYGKDLLMMGGFDKHILAKSKRDIELEVRRLDPLVQDGGYVPFCDHRVPPDVPYENYLFYLDRARKVWGRGVDLKRVEWSV